MKYEEKSTDRMIAESAVTGIVAGGIVAALVNLIGFKRIVILGIIGYIVYKIFW